VANKPGHQGEREVSRNTIAQEMPGVPVPCGDYPRVLSTFARGTAGAPRTRRFLRPLVFGADEFAKPGRIVPRERRLVSMAHPSRRPRSGLLRMRSRVRQRGTSHQCKPHGEEAR
jgi:hypothetical protein